MTRSELATEVTRHDPYRLAGKRVLITGASRGLGRSCAEAFAKAGCKVLLAARAKAQLEEVRASLDSPEEHAIYAGDLTRLEAVEALAAAVEAFGELDVLLHVMGGGLGLTEPLLGWEAFETLFRTNLGSAAELNRRLIPRMVERKSGNVVLVGSIASSEAVGSVGYNSIKAALAAYTRTLGRKMAETGVIVTGILPGGFWAPDNVMARFQQRDPEQLEQIIAQRYPRKRLGDAAEIIPLMMFLASRQATMMTGCCVPIDGGEGLAYV